RALPRLRTSSEINPPCSGPVFEDPVAVVIAVDSFLAEFVTEMSAQPPVDGHDRHQRVCGQAEHLVEMLVRHRETRARPAAIAIALIVPRLSPRDRHAVRVPPDDSRRGVVL